MSDDFIIEESSAEPASGGPFLASVAVLVAIFIFAALCGGGWYLVRDSGDGAPDNTAEIAVIETQNAIVAVTNEAVTATIAAMETEAAVTPSPPVPPTSTFVPTSTPAPTNTRVLQPVDGDGTVTSEAADSEATSVFPEASGGTPTPIPGAGSGSGSGDGGGTLPETGIGMWAAVLAAAALVAVLIGARKLRAN